MFSLEAAPPHRAGLYEASPWARCCARCSTNPLPPLILLTTQGEGMDGPRFMDEERGSDQSPLGPGLRPRSAQVRSSLICRAAVGGGKEVLRYPHVGLLRVRCTSRGTPSTPSKTGLPLNSTCVLFSNEGQHLMVPFVTRTF